METEIIVLIVIGVLVALGAAYYYDIGGLKTKLGKQDSSDENNENAENTETESENTEPESKESESKQSVNIDSEKRDSEITEANSNIERSSLPSPSVPPRIPLPSPSVPPRIPLPSPSVPPRYIPEISAASSKTISNCQDTPATLSCASGKITAGLITYGRYDNTICPHSTVTASTSVTKKKYALPSKCNQSNCSINMDFDDPVPGVYKHYSVTYSCGHSNAAPSSLPVGSAISCSANNPGNGGEVYRLVDPQTIAWYPGPDIAKSWDPNFGAAKTIDCAGLQRGFDMTMKI